jgi:hypothetical protein
VCYQRVDENDGFMRRVGGTDNSGLDTGFFAQQKFQQQGHRDVSLGFSFIQIVVSVKDKGRVRVKNIIYQLIRVVSSH